ncbi:MAG: trehalose-phosphatase [Betaproteobacteria bacterium]
MRLPERRTQVPPMPAFACDWALFLDIDGTLLEIAETPGQVHADRADHKLLESVRDAAGGAAALISGRSLAVIDELFHPLRMPAAGLHGVERRDAHGEVHRPALPFEALQYAATALRDFARSHAGLVLENKGYSLALHYRRAPELEQAAHLRVLEVAHMLGDWVEVQGGKMVAEIKPAGRHKGTAIDEFMREAPFRGRVPLFVGDDLTDEHGFQVVNRLGGHSIKVGPEPSAATWRIKDPRSVRAWLRDWVRHCASA